MYLWKRTDTSIVILSFNAVFITLFLSKNICIFTQHGSDNLLFRYIHQNPNQICQCLQKFHLHFHGYNHYLFQITLKIFKKIYKVNKHYVSITPMWYYFIIFFYI